MLNFTKIMLILISAIYITFPLFLPKQRIHIFIDYATSPTILQMINFIKLPEKDIKIIGWNRYLNRNKIIKKHNIQKNVIEISYLLKYQYQAKQKELNHLLSKIESNYPNTVYELHINYKHFDWTGIQLLKLIPQYKIKQIHLYEDGAGTLYQEIHEKSIQDFGLKFTKRIKEELKKEEPRSLYHPNAYAIAIPTLYPTTFHTTLAEKVKTIEEQAFYQNFKKLKIQSVDFRKLKKDLTSEEKTKLYKLLDINFSKINKYAQSNKPFGLFLWDGKDISKRYQAEKKLLDKMEEHTKKNGTIWFSKNHPTAPHAYLPRPFLKPLPPHFPMEVLLLSDYPFKYVAGAGSSAFYSLKPEEIVAYIPNHRQDYIKSLIDVKILDKEKVYNW